MSSKVTHLPKKSQLNCYTIFPKSDTVGQQLIGDWNGWIHYINAYQRSVDLLIEDYNDYTCKYNQNKPEEQSLYFHPDDLLLPIFNAILHLIELRVKYLFALTEDVIAEKRPKEEKRSVSRIRATHSIHNLISNLIILMEDEKLTKPLSALRVIEKHMPTLRRVYKYFWIFRYPVSKKMDYREVTLCNISISEMKKLSMEIEEVYHDIFKKLLKEIDCYLVLSLAVKPSGFFKYKETRLRL
ncbi:MAG: hypothetical protein P9X24_04380 [Candidatus Hatepunaea meridiana]|nr:hypothetical protein [Candidatus Hatepunaea meridiana]